MQQSTDKANLPQHVTHVMHGWWHLLALDFVVKQDHAGLCGAEAVDWREAQDLREPGNDLWGGGRAAVAGREDAAAQLHLPEVPDQLLQSQECMFIREQCFAGTKYRGQVRTLPMGSLAASHCLALMLFCRYIMLCFIKLICHRHGQCF